MFNYSEIILEHFYHPHNVGEFTVNKNVLSGKISTPDKSTVMQLQIQLNKSMQRKIITAKFKAYGCPCSIAVMSLLTQWLEKKSLEQANMITSKELITTLALPREKYYCALLGEDLVKLLLKQMSTTV